MNHIITNDVMEVDPQFWKIKKITVKYVYIFERNNNVHTGFVLYRAGHSNPRRRYFVYKKPLFTLLDNSMTDVEISRLFEEENLTFEDNEFL